MAHELQERYSPLVLAKMRKESILKDGVVFNNDYEGNPTSGAVKIPVRDGEVKVSDYDKANGITATTGSTTYQTLTINKDKAVGEIIDGYDAAGVPDNLVADRLDSAGYSLARTIDEDGASWVNGRMVYAHKVLRPVAIRNVFCPGSLEIAFAAGSANGSTIAAVSAGNTGTTYAYKVNPASRAKFSQTTASYGGTTLTSGTTEITAAVGDVVEIVNLSSGKVVAVGYHTITASEVKA